MTRKEFLQLCCSTYSAEPDYPFEGDFETAVLRHSDNKKWFALLMRLSGEKLGRESRELLDVVNLKLPKELYGSFGEGEGVYPAYHMNKLHWISVSLKDVSEDLLQFLLALSYEATMDKRKKKLK